MSKLIHLDDEAATRDRYRSYCGVVNSPLTAARDRADDHCVLQGGIKITLDAAVATCPECINNYETRPQPVTTADLLEVLRVAGWLARSGSPRTGPNPALAAQAKLERRLERPRKIVRDRAVTDGTCRR